jgi:hypothetical protein
VLSHRRGTWEETLRIAIGSMPSWHQIIASWFKPSRYLQYLKAEHLC